MVRLNATEGSWFVVAAGSGYGMRFAYYQIVDSRLVLRDAGEPDALWGNDRAVEFTGLTPDEAAIRVATMNPANPGHPFDDCHMCLWHIFIAPVHAQDLPEHLRR